MKKQSDMLAKLAKTVDKGNKRHTKAQPAPVPVPSTGSRCTKLSISVHDEDLTAIDGIRSYMAQGGRHLSRSQAVKLALRTVKLDAGLSQALATIQAADGRRKG